MAHCGLRLPISDETSKCTGSIFLSPPHHYHHQLSVCSELAESDGTPFPRLQARFVSYMHAAVTHVALMPARRLSAVKECTVSVLALRSLYLTERSSKAGPSILQGLEAINAKISPSRRIRIQQSATPV